MQTWQFYKEKSTGDFLVARPSKPTNGSKLNLFEVIGPSKPRRIRSLNYDVASGAYLKLDCTPVPAKDVPPDWYEALRYRLEREGFRI